MPPAARVGDNHTCPMVEANPHVGGPVMGGCPTVLIGYKPAACIGDLAACVGGTLDVITTGAMTVFIGGRPAARIADFTAHGGMVMGCCETVTIGSAPQGASFMSASAPLVERCDRKNPPSP